MAELEFDTGHFLFIAARDIVTRTYGVKTKEWPERNFYALISTIKDNIRSEHIPKLMRQYKVGKLKDYGRYFDVLPQEQDDEEITEP
jgi:hypothetical protein